MKYSIKPKNDSDKENAKQLELIMNHKLATYDDISEVIFDYLKEEKQPKENHPYGWYRKFDKKRF